MFDGRQRNYYLSTQPRPRVPLTFVCVVLWGDGRKRERRKTPHHAITNQEQEQAHHHTRRG